MSLIEKLNSDLKDAMKAGDKVKTQVLRQVKTAVTNTEIKKGKTLSDEEISEVIFSLVKSHNESIESFKKGARQDLVDIEEKENVVLKSYLPAELTEEELKAIVAETIKETGAAGPKDTGRVMGKVMPKVKGRADGSRINLIVKELLK